MAWRLVQIPDEEAVKGDFEGDLTNGELIGISILLTHNAGEPYDDYNVYWRAREKIQPQVEKAFEAQFLED
jgi:hypothetical protein